MSNEEVRLKTFTAGHVTIEMLDDELEFEGKPSRDAEPTTGLAKAARLTTPDGFDALIGVVTWPTGDVDVRVVHFQSGAEPYKRLDHAGTMNLKVIDGAWVARIRAMKVNGREWATLNRVTWEELDWLAGDDFKATAAIPDGPPPECGDATADAATPADQPIR